MKKLLLALTIIPFALHADNDEKSVAIGTKPMFEKLIKSGGLRKYLEKQTPEERKKFIETNPIIKSIKHNDQPGEVPLADSFLKKSFAELYYKDLLPKCIEEFENRDCTELYSYLSGNTEVDKGYLYNLFLASTYFDPCGNKNEKVLHKMYLFYTNCVYKKMQKEKSL